MKAELPASYGATNDRQDPSGGSRARTQTRKPERPETEPTGVGGHGRSRTSIPRDGSWPGATPQSAEPAPWAQSCRRAGRRAHSTTGSASGGYNDARGPLSHCADRRTSVVGCSRATHPVGAVRHSGARGRAQACSGERHPSRLAHAGSATNCNTRRWHPTGGAPQSDRSHRLGRVPCSSPPAPRQTTRLG